MTANPIGTLVRPDGLRLACRTQPGRTPHVVFLSGFGSTMGGAKAEHLAEWCRSRGQAFVRFDYAGHGDSQGRLEEFRIGDWRADTGLVLDTLGGEPVILVGSSMGGWLGLLVALDRPQQVAALVGIAAAPDFTEDLMWDAMAPPERAALLRDGAIEVPSRHGPPQRISRGLVEEGRHHLLLRQPIPLHRPVRLLHGMADPDVPWETALRLAEKIEGGDVQITLVRDGDHRLSRPADLALLGGILAGLLGEDGT